MVRIVSLEMQGFKSFANKIRIITKEGLNVVVGPNGSGKSNISDAICFVLGKTKKKELRAGKMSHLVFNGGYGGNPSDLAKVVITFENNGDFKIKDKEIRISRTVNKDGNSVFRINGKRAVLAEVMELLYSANIDPEGFNIIMQGEINKFVDISNAQRRGIIEKICGIEAYEKKKHKTMLELEKVEEKVKERRITLSEKEKYLQELIKEKNQAENYIKLQNSLSLLKAKQIFKQKKNLEKDEAERVSLITSLLKKKEGIENKIEEDSKAAKELEEQISEIEEQLGKKGQEEERKLRDDIERLSIELQKTENSINNSNNQIKKINEREKQILSNIRDSEKEIESLKAETEKSERQMEQLEKKANEFKSVFKEYSPIEVKTRAIELGMELRSLNTEIETNRKNLETEKRLLKEIEDFSEEKNSLEAKSTKLSFKIVQVNKKINEINEYLSHLDKERVKYETQLSSTRIHRANQAILSMNNPQVLGEIMSLLEIPERYAKAIYALAGSRTNVIVAKDKGTAISCINQAKSNRWGYISVLPIDSINVPKPRQKHANAIARAVDVVKFRPEYSKVAEWLFGDSLIAENLEKTRDISNFRISTLDGDLVEKSGLLKGGYRKGLVNFDRASIEKKIDGLDSERNKYLEYLKELKAEIQKMDSKEAEKEVSEIELKLKEAKMRRENLGILGQKELMRKQMKILEMERELKKLEALEKDNELEKVSDELKKIEERMSKIAVEKKGNELKFKISSGELLKIKNVLGKIREEREDFQKISEEESSNKKDIQKKLSSVKKEHEEFFTKLRGFHNKKEQIRKKLNAVESRKKGNESAKYKAEQERQKIELQRAELSAKIHGLKEKYAEFEHFNIQKVYEKEGEISRSIWATQQKIDKFGSVNMKALETYNQIKEEYDKLNQKVETLVGEKDELLSRISGIDNEKAEVFMKAFKGINDYFQRIYTELTDGEAKLVIEDKENLFEKGMEILVRPKGKRFVILRSLSGGEKTIVALAFLFAIQEYSPAPFYILDEIEAALDKLNSKKLAELVKKYSKKSQFLVITHNDEIVASADYLYGVAINKHGVSNVVAIKVPD